MVERITDTAIINDEGEVLPFIEGHDDYIPLNADLIDEAALDDLVEKQQRKDEALEQAIKRYEELLDAEDSTAPSTEIARERLAARGIHDPRPHEEDSISSKAMEAQRLRAEAREEARKRQEIELGLTGEVHRTPEADVALKALKQEADEATIQNLIKDGYTETEARVRIKIKNERKNRGY